MDRIKKLKLNTICSLSLQICNIISGMILPRFFLVYYGSKVNGLVSSITNFLSIIAFLECGVGAVIISALYKPLAFNDNKKVSEIITSGQRFYRKIAYILFVYVVLLIFIYPSVIENSFDFWFTASLILILSINSFSQYYFGIIDRLLLTADQYGFIQYTSQIVSLVLNTSICIVLITCGATIHMVKLASSLVFLLRPFVIRIYINKRYTINRNAKYEIEPIEQKWNGLAQHIAAIVLDGTDTIVLTLFSTLENVSIYGVYHFVVSGIRQLIDSLSASVKELLGELWAKEEYDSVNRIFNSFEWIMHTGVTLLFGCTAVLIVPFVTIYTEGVNDANYIAPLFALLITVAYACHSLRQPYLVMILVAGHYKQTQKSFIIAAVLNLLVSVSMVYFFGLVGVAIGTLVAMLYQTIYMAIYDSKFLLKRSIVVFIKHVIVDVIIFILILAFVKPLNTCSSNYLSWILLSIKVVAISTGISFIVNVIVYKNEINTVISKFKLRKS